MAAFLTPEERIERLRRAAERMGGKAALGRMLGYVDGAFVGQMIKGDRPITEKTLEALIAIPDISDLFSFNALSGFKIAMNDEAAKTANVRPIESRARVPQISWVQAGSLSEVQDLFQPGEADKWEDAFYSNPSRHAFALLVDGESMISPYPTEKSFPPGTILIVDPDHESWAGDFVIAKDVSTQQATFKKLVHDGGRWFLKPLNPSYPTIEIDDPSLRVIGKVIEYRNGGKL